MDGQLNNVCIDKHIKKTITFETTGVAAVFSTFEFIKSTQERHYIIFVSFKLHKVIIRANRCAASLLGKL